MSHRVILIDYPSAKWAWYMGFGTRAVTPRGIEGRKVCPFAEDTPHRRFWYAGWLGQAVEPLLDEEGLHGSS